jgi:hypothetical protein
MQPARQSRDMPPRLSKERERKVLGRYAELAPAHARPIYADIIPNHRRHAASFDNFSGGDSPNLDPNNRLPHQRPDREHWGPRKNKALDGRPDVPKAEAKNEPPRPPTPGMRGKLAKVAGAFLSAMAEMFPPPVNSGLRPAYTPSMSIGGRRPEPD